MEASTETSSWAFNNQGREVESGFVALEQIKNMLSTGDHSLVVFLDYDGTLSPIVSDPSIAYLPGKTKTVLQRLAALVPTIIISGRSIRTLKDFVQIDSILYAGSHGQKVEKSAKFEHSLVVGENYKMLLRASYDKIAEAIAGISGSQLEWNDLCFSVHYRRVPEENREALITAVHSIVEKVMCMTKGSEEDGTGEYMGLKIHRGKMVLEIRPKVIWNKGRCVSWFLEKLSSEVKQVGKSLVSLYIGDDLTDEDAFTELNKNHNRNSFSIIVAENRGVTLQRKTHANYLLECPSEVASFLRDLTEFVLLAETKA